MPTATRRPHRRCSTRSLETIPAPEGDADAPLQALVTNLDASDYLGRLAIGRVVEGTLRRGETVALCDEETSVDEDGRPLNPLSGGSRRCSAFDGISRVDVDDRPAGDLFVVAGFPEVEIGDTLADPERTPSRCRASSSTSRFCG